MPFWNSVGSSPVAAILRTRPLSGGCSLERARSEKGGSDVGFGELLTLRAKDTKGVRRLIY